ncbi:MAG: hypothetical protein E7289_03180 [Lachnospiraceae bacterium]|nr:hypothetical protein [Lachnospiraceae bacterium]
MQIKNYNQIEQAVSDAGLVLVGLGEEWVLTEKDILDDLSIKNRFLYELYLEAMKKDGYAEVGQLLTAYYYMNYIPDSFRSAYENLLQLVGNKNYFVVSLTIDSYLKRCGFKEDRCVNPCGTFEKIQCDIGCEHVLSSSEQLMEEVSACLIKAEKTDQGSQEALESILKQCLDIKNKYKCETCGSVKCFNILEAKKYREEGYLERWQTYMKWLQGTLNRNLCVIEAGAGMKLPSVIRWPFEKTVFYNQKSKMFRIHDKFYQINEEVSDRSYGCRCNAVHLFDSKKVEAFE